MLRKCAGQHSQNICMTLLPAKVKQQGQESAHGNSPMHADQPGTPGVLDRTENTWHSFTTLQSDAMG